MIKEITLAVGMLASSLFGQELINQENFQQKIDKNWSVVNYKVDEDKDCKKFAPRFKEAEVLDVNSYEINLVTNKGERCSSPDWREQKVLCSDFVEKHGIDATPTIVLYKDGRKVNQIFGTPDASTLENWIYETIYAFESKPEIEYAKPGKVVLVPDWQTALYEMCNFDGPVLLEDHKLTKKFLEKYGGEVVVKGKSSVRFDQQKIMREFSHDNPSGVVVVDMKDPNTMIGGLALAKAHKQKVLFVDRGLYGIDDLLTERQAKRFREKVLTQLEKLNIDYKESGNLDFVTVACDVSFAFKGKYRFLDYKYALDDLLTRDRDGKKYAYYGRLTGKQALYQAMCSLFLQPKKALFFNTIWPELYQTHQSDNAVEFAGKIFDVQHIKRPECTEKRLKQELEKGYDFVLFQSRGTPDEFTVYSGKNIANKLGFYEKTIFDEDGKSGLRSLFVKNPMIFLANPHSYAGADPYNPNTIAGKLLNEGAYTLSGALAEPGKSSFNTPADIIIALLNGKTISEATQDRSITKGSYYESKEDGDFFYFDAAPEGTSYSRIVFVGDPRKIIVSKKR
ncbi:thioredoxin family protein [Candidatus Woesearchaeota archaeon]|nr:thioredoxin family protein [Candidatus Woesearchaeota archaeon]